MTIDHYTFESKFDVEKASEKKAIVLLVNIPNTFNNVCISTSNLYLNSEKL